MNCFRLQLVLTINQSLCFWTLLWRRDDFWRSSFIQKAKGCQLFCLMLCGRRLRINMSNCLFKRQNVVVHNSVPQCVYQQDSNFSLGGVCLSRYKDVWDARPVQWATIITGFCARRTVTKTCLCLMPLIMYLFVTITLLLRQVRTQIVVGLVIYWFRFFILRVFWRDHAFKASWNTLFDWRLFRCYVDCWKWAFSCTSSYFGLSQHLLPVSGMNFL